MKKLQFRDLDPGDVEWLVSQHELLYGIDQGFDESFGVMVRGILNRYLANHNPDRERSWVATQNNERVGTIFCTDEGSDIVQLRMLLVLPVARGTGLGRRLVEECVNFGRQKNYEVMRLWTFKSLSAACALYESVGFECIQEKPAHGFGVNLVEQTWELPLQRNSNS